MYAILRYYAAYSSILYHVSVQSIGLMFKGQEIPE